ncbi:MAG: AbrB/MazE/SpoVT family DNA-binding domain-containing protein [Coriobacteriales bacterium]|jgi:antitoxin MazE|nr:AbrB/MazE/SpoVT family DNA-binding domain-containing protein [Coriobacteriales bacterium]
MKQNLDSTPGLTYNKINIVYCLEIGMGHTATIGMWGNTQAIRLPKAYCEQLGLRAGDEVELSLESRRLVIEKPEERYTIQNLMKDWNGIRGGGPELSWGEPVGSELW